MMLVNMQLEKTQKHYHWRRYSSIDKIGEAQWNSVWTSQSEGWDFYRIYENAEVEGVKFSYFCVYCGDELIAIAPAFAICFNLELGVSEKAGHWIRQVQKIFPKFLVFKSVFCGAINSERSRCGIRGDFLVDSENIFKQFASALEDFRREEGAWLAVFKDFCSEDDAEFFGLSRALKGLGYRMTAGLPNKYIPIHFASVEEYLKTLSSSTRKNLQRKMKDVHSLKSPLVVEEYRRIDGYIDQIYDLYEKTYRHSNHHFEKLTKKYFYGYSRELKNAIFFLYFVQNDGQKKMIGFNLCTLHRDKNELRLFDKYIGLDYELSIEYSLYFISFLKNIEWCVANKVNKYVLNQGGDELKNRLGARDIPLWNFTKVSCPLFKNLKSPFSLRVLSLIFLTDFVQFLLLMSLKKLTELLVPRFTDFLNISSALNLFVDLFQSWPFWVVIFSMLTSLIVWPAVLSFLELSVAFPLAAISYVIVPFLSVLFLNEKISGIRWFGILLVVVGIAILAKKPENGKANQMGKDL